MQRESLPPLVLICGGENSRLNVLQGSIYKPFLDLQGSTIVAKYIERARREGVERVAVVTDERDGLVSRLLTEIRTVAPAVEILEIFDGGTIGQKISAAVDCLAANEVFACLGDTFAWYSFADLAGKRGYDSSLVVTLHSSRFGVVETRGDSVSRFSEKPTTRDLINLGQMLLGPRALRALAEGSTMEAALSELAGRGELGFLEASRREVLTLDSIADVIAADVRVRDRGWE